MVDVIQNNFILDKLQELDFIFIFYRVIDSYEIINIVLFIPHRYSKVYAFSFFFPLNFLCFYSSQLWISSNCELHSINILFICVFKKLYKSFLFILSCFIILNSKRTIYYELSSSKLH